MSKHLLLLLLIGSLATLSGYAQQCECIGCDQTIPISSTTDYSFIVSGAANNDLSDSLQGVCGVVVEFRHNFIWDLEIFLTSPAGETIQLIGPQVIPPLGSFTGLALWDISFVPDSSMAFPDAGFTADWDNDQAWQVFGLYNGSYYPYQGMLEEFDLGMVDGTWTFTVVNNSTFYEGYLIDLNIIFCDGFGLDCNRCFADGGSLGAQSDIAICDGDELALALEASYTGDPPDSMLYDYTFILSQNDTLIDYRDTLFTGDLPPGTYDVCGFSYLEEDANRFLTPNGRRTLTDLLSLTTDPYNPFLCGDLADSCFTLTISGRDTTLLDFQRCAGQVITVGGETFDSTGVYEVVLPNNAFCDSLIIIDLVVEDSIQTFVEEEICEGDTVFVGGFPFTQTGLFDVGLTAVDLCDSIVTIDLTVLDTFHTRLSALICLGDSLTIGTEVFKQTGQYEVTLTASNSCDSLIFLDLVAVDQLLTDLDTTICAEDSIFIGTEAFFADGFFERTLPSSIGCDSVIRLQLDVRDPILFTIDSTICQGDVLEAGGALFTQTGQFEVTIPSYQDCDSLIDIQLTVLDTVQTFIDTLICAEASIEIGTFTFDTDGSYRVVLQQVNGCDSIVYLNLQKRAPVVEPISRQICEGDTLFVGTTPFTTGGFFEETLTSSLGCDSLVQLSLQVIDSIFFQVDTVICAGQEVNIEGLLFDESGQYQITRSSQQFPCDSTIILNLTVLDSAINRIDTTICQGQFLFLEGAPYFQTGAYTILTRSEILNCDSFIFLDLVVDQLDTTFLYDTICFGESFTYLGDDLNIADEYEYNLVNQNNCDSTVFLNLFIRDSIGSNEVLEACEGDTVRIDIYEITETGVYVLDLTDPTTGCDSTVTLTATFFDRYQVPIREVICDGEIYSLGDSMFTESGFYEVSLLSQNGCDSLIQLTLDVQTNYDVFVRDTACAGTSYIVGDSVFTEPGIYQVPLLSEAGCDSLVTIDLFIRDSIQIDLREIICDGQSFELGGQSFNIQDDYIVVVPGAANCDTFYFLDLIVLSPDAFILAPPLLDCDNAPLTLDGSNSSSGPGITYQWTHSGGNGIVSGADTATPEIDQPGLYTLIVTETLDGETCISIASIGVGGTSIPPIAIASGNDLSCDNPESVLNAFSPSSNVSILWTGPNGFSDSTQNPIIDEPGTYILTVTAANGCETSDTLDILLDNDPPVFNVSADTINCNRPTVSLEVDTINLNWQYFWSGPTGFFSFIPEPVVNGAGWYYLTVTAANGCIGVDSVEVIADTEIPMITANFGTIGCPDSLATLSATSTIPGTIFLWQGPGGFQAFASDTVTSTPGFYVMTAIPPNGCTANAFGNIVEDFTPPQVIAFDDTLSCVEPSISLSAQFTSGATLEWFGPNGFFSDEETPMVNQVGTYIVVATGINECTAADTIEVLADTDLPVFTLQGDTITCDQPDVVVEAVGSSPSDTISWLGPNGFISNFAANTVLNGGWYFVTVTSESGCSTTDSIQIEVDTFRSSITLLADPISCVTPTVPLAVIVSGDYEGILWEGPNGFNSFDSLTQVTEPGWYQVEVSFDNGCTSLDSIFVESDLDIPVYSISAGELNCDQTTTTITFMSADLGAQVEWIFPDGSTSTDFNLIVDSAGVYEVSITFSNGCSVEDEVTIIEDTALANLTLLSDTLNCDQTEVMLTALGVPMSATPTWTGSNSFSSSVLFNMVSDPGWYRLQLELANGCTQADSIEILIDTIRPMWSIESSLINCDSLTSPLNVVLQNGATEILWTGPNGFQSDLANNVITEGGWYYLDLFPLNGCDVQDSVFVPQNTDFPEITLSADTINCTQSEVLVQVSSLDVLDSIRWIGPNGFEATDAQFSTLISGTYQVLVIAANNCRVVDSIEVIQDVGIPTLTLTADTINCSQAIVPLSGTVDVPNAILDWEGPNGFSSNDSVNQVSTPGTYILTASLPNGCSQTDSIQVLIDTIQPVWSITAGFIDCDSTTAPLSVQVTDPTIPLQWTGPNSFQSDQPNNVVLEGGWYYLDLLPENGCTVTDSVFIDESTEAPTLVLSADTLNCNQSEATLTVSSSDPVALLEWSGPNGFSSNDNQVTSTLAGVYYVVATSANNCSTLDSIEVIEDFEEPAVLLTSDTITCAQSEVDLIVQVSNPATNLTWTGPGGFSSAAATNTVTVPGLYYLTSSLPNGCSQIDSIEVLIDTIPPVWSLEADSINCINSFARLALNHTGSGTVILWTGPNGFASDQEENFVFVGGWYYIDIRPSNGCNRLDSIFVNQDTDFPTIDLATDTIDCDQTEVTISLSSSDLSGAVEWTGPGGFSESGYAVTATTPGVYEVVITSANGCSAMDSIEVVQDVNIPEISLFADTLSCAQSTVDLIGSVNIPNANLLWTGPNGFQSNLAANTVDVAGIYSLRASLPNGCTQSDSIEVVVDSIFPVTSLFTDTITCTRTVVPLEVNVSQGTGAILWTGPAGFQSDQVTNTVSTGGWYVVEIRPDNGCITRDSVFVVEDNVIPSAFATGDTINCADTIGTLIAMTNDPGAQVQWTGPTGIKQNGLEISTLIPGTYQVLITSANGCSSTASAEVVLDNTIPQSFIPFDTITCTEPMVTLQGNFTPADVNILWEGPGGFTSTIAQPTATIPGDYFVTLTGDNGCVIQDATFIFEDRVLPLAEAIGDTITCNKPTVSLEAMEDPMIVSYQWELPNGSSLDEALIQTQAGGLYTLTTESLNGCTNTTIVEVLVDTFPPQLSALVDTLTCSDTTVMIMADLQNADSFSWSGPGVFDTQAANPVVREPGVYTLSATSVNGCESSLDIEVVEDIADPQVDAMGDTLTCVKTTAQLQGFIPNPQVTYEWSGPNNFSSTSLNPVVTTSGSYTLTGQGRNGCLSTMTVEVVADTLPPSLTYEVDTLTCTVLDVTFQSIGNGASYSYEWEGPNNFESFVETPQVNQPGLYAVTLTGQNGCTITNQIEVIQDTVLLIADAGPDTLINCFLPRILIGTDRTSQGTDITYQWSDQSGSTLGNGLFLEVESAGTYTLLVEDADGCFQEDTVTVLDESNDPLAEITPLTPLPINCDNTSVVLSAENSIPIPSLVVRWSQNQIPFSEALQIEVNQGGSYQLWVQDTLTGCVDSTTLLVAKDTIVPTIQIITPPILSCRDSIIEINASNSDQGPQYNYQWTTSNGSIVSGAQTPTPLVDRGGTYVLSIFNVSNGCSAEESIVVEADTIPPLAFASTIGFLDCLNPTATVTGMGSSVGINYTYQWIGSPDILQPNALETQVFDGGTYTLQVLDQSNGCISFDSTYVEEDEIRPTGLNLTLEAPECFNDTNGLIFIDSVIGGRAPYFYSLNGEVLSQVYAWNRLAAGTYTISVEDQKGCTFDTTVVLSNPPELTLDLGLTLNFALGDSTELVPDLSIPWADVDTFFWTPLELITCPSCTTQIIKSFVGGTITLRVLDENGCEVEDFVQLNVDGSAGVFAPNIFTPNGDDINDNFTLFADQSVAEIQSLRIFSRWGDLVFENENFAPNDPELGWDGSFEGQMVNPAVFVYIAKVVLLDGRVEVIRGDVTVRR